MGCGMSRGGRYHYAIADDPYYHGAPLQTMGPRCGRRRGYRQGPLGPHQRRGGCHRRPVWASQAAGPANYYPQERMTGPPGHGFASPAPVPEGFKEEPFLEGKFDDGPMPLVDEGSGHYQDYYDDSVPPRYSKISDRRG